MQKRVFLNGVCQKIVPKVIWSTILQHTVHPDFPNTRQEGGHKVRLVAIKPRLDNDQASTVDYVF